MTTLISTAFVLQIKHKSSKKRHVREINSSPPIPPHKLFMSWKWEGQANNNTNKFGLFIACPESRAEKIQYTKINYENLVKQECQIQLLIVLRALSFILSRVGFFPSIAGKNLKNHAVIPWNSVYIKYLLPFFAKIWWKNLHSI